MGGHVTVHYNGEDETLEEVRQVTSHMYGQWEVEYEDGRREYRCCDLKTRDRDVAIDHAAR